MFCVGIEMNRWFEMDQKKPKHLPKLMLSLLRIAVSSKSVTILLPVFCNKLHCIFGH